MFTKKSDCLEAFNELKSSELKNSCQGKRTCGVWFPHETGINCKIASMSTRIIYTCYNNKAVGGIVGGVIGVLLLAVIIGLAGLCFIRRRRKKRASTPPTNLDKIKETAEPSSASSPHYFEIEPTNTEPKECTGYSEIDLTENVNGRSNIFVVPASKQRRFEDSARELDYDEIGNGKSFFQNAASSNYNHIGIQNSQVEYCQFGGENSNIPRSMLDNYNHINPLRNSDEYHRLGETVKPKIVDDGNYNHIGPFNQAGTSDDASVTSNTVSLSEEHRCGVRRNR